MLLNFWIHEQALATLFQNFNSMSDYRDISLQSWRPKWTKDDHFQWAKFNHFYIVRGLPAMQSENLQSISTCFFLYNDTTVLPKLCVKSQIWVEKDHCVQHIKLLLCKFWKNFLLIKDEIDIFEVLLYLKFVF